MSLVIMDEDLYRSISKISSHSYFMPVGRAAWAIFASLKIHNTDKKQVIAMPSFVCQSVVAAAVASGWEIVFLDINLNNANVNSDEYLRAIQKHKIDAVLFVHLLGNKNELNGLQSECRKNGILLIEDSAQFCDQHDIDNYTELSCIKIFSFGYSKPIDAGGGGILCTDDKSIMEELKHFSNAYDFKSKVSLEDNSISFKDKFYQLKDSITENEKEKFHFPELLEIYLPLVDIHVPCSDSLKAKVIDGISQLEKKIRIRTENWEKYKKFLNCDSLIPLHDEGSIPWRASYRIEGMDYSLQNKISNSIRANGFDVSNWYLPAHWYIDPKDSADLKLQNTVKLSKEIIQFWVDRELNIRHFNSLNNTINRLIDAEKQGN